MGATELALMRKQTKHYIAQNKDDVVLLRPTKVDDGAGGHTESDVPQPPQVMRIIQQREGSGTERRNRDGEVVRPDLVLLAEWDADVKRNDRFKWRSYTAEVVYVQALEDQGGVYELTCEVALV